MNNSRFSAFFSANHEIPSGISTITMTQHLNFSSEFMDFFFRNWNWLFASINCEFFPGKIFYANIEIYSTINRRKINIFEKKIFYNGRTKKKWMEDLFVNSSILLMNSTWWWIFSYTIETMRMKVEYEV